MWTSRFLKWRRCFIRCHRGLVEADKATTFAKLDVPETSQGRSAGESKATQKVHVHDSFQVQVFVQLLQGGFGCMQGDTL